MVVVNKFFGALLLLTTSTLTFAAEPYFKAGWSAYSIRNFTGNPTLDSERAKGNGFHLGAGVRKKFGGDHYIGAGIDLDSIAGQHMAGYRAIDYQYQLSKLIVIGSFFGAASLDSGLPQNGYYTGINLSYTPSVQNLGLVFEIRYASGLARDKLLDTDPQNLTDEYIPDIFADITSGALLLNWRF